MDMLHSDGYGVGRGTWTAGVVDPVKLTQGNSSAFLTDSTIRSDLQKEISAKALSSPGANSLYVVYVEDNVPVERSSTSNSISNFSSYHSFFNGVNASGQATPINYVVVTVPGGSVGNTGGGSNLSTWQHMNVNASHTIVEAVTNPEGGVAPGWVDSNLDDEIPDQADGHYVFLHGYAVQRVSDTNDQDMTPMGAQSYQAESFVLEKNGNLYRHLGVTTPLLVATGVASVSSQTINAQGRASVAYVDTSGNAWQYDDIHKAVEFTTPKAGTVARVVESGTVTYFLLTTGQLTEQKYNPVTSKTIYQTLASNVASISAGLDQHGVSSVDYVTKTGAAYEHSDSTGVHLIRSSGVASVSGGPLGEVGVVLTTGESELWEESTGKLTETVASGVARLTLGTTITTTVSSLLVERLDKNGNLWEYSNGASHTPILLKTGVIAISTPRAGVVDVILTNHAAYEHSDTTNTWTTLDSNPVIAVS